MPPSGPGFVWLEIIFYCYKEAFSANAAVIYRRVFEKTTTILPYLLT